MIIDNVEELRAYAVSAVEAMAELENKLEEQKVYIISPDGSKKRIETIDTFIHEDMKDNTFYTD